MKQYYEILDVPITATPAEIKAQYRQLVRIYHPDRFRDQDDKAYAEEKLKEINIAFQVLSGTSVHREPFEARVAPQPVVHPPELDFGTAAVGQKVSRRMQVGNIGGAAESINFVYSTENPWFRVSKGKRVYAGQPFPLDFEVVVDTRRLTPGERHQAWLEAVLDGIPVRVALQVNVAKSKRALRPSALLRWSLAGLFVLLIALFLTPLLGQNGIPLRLTESLISARPAYELHQNEMLFSVQENSDSAFYVGLGQSSSPRRLGLDGVQAVASHVGQRIAYLDQIDGVNQLFLFELSSGETIQVTESTYEKALPAWSADGLRIAYLAGGAEEQLIGVYDIRSGQEQLLPSASVAGVENFAWSPDGQSLLFDLRQGDEQRVYRMGARGENLVQLTDFNSWAGAWSADGTQILVGTDNGIYLLDSEGRRLQQISNVPAASFHPSADGEWLVYTTTRDLKHNERGRQFTGNQALWLMDRNGKNLRQVTAESASYQWSPTGATLGYVTGNPERENSLLYLWTVTPGESPQLAAEVNSPFFSWPQ